MSDARQPEGGEGGTECSPDTAPGSTRPQLGEEATGVVADPAPPPPGGEASPPRPPPSSAQGAEPESLLAPGCTLSGRYSVLTQLGQGGMGVVVAAYDVRLDRRVALKLLLPARDDAETGSPGRELRMVREAQAMARLNHPNVVALFDSGTLEDGRVFLAMEYVQGKTLRQWCSEQPRSWREVLGAYVAAGRGLAAAHAAGLVHRDFKAENVLVGQDGRVRVTDFGLARSETLSTGSDSSIPTPSPGAHGPPAAMLQALPMGVWESPLTLPGKVMGTLKYLAPELLRGQPADARSDLFAFCVALYEALFGQPAFGSGQGKQERLRAHLEGEVNPPPARSEVPRRVTRALLKGLKADPRQRPLSLQALLVELEDDPAVRLRARLQVAAVAGVVLALGAGAVGGWLRTPAPSCAQVAVGRLEGVWDGAVQARVRQALLGTGLSYAQATSERVEAVLARYSGQWVKLRTGACEAGQAPTRQARDLAVLQVYCLERRRSQLQALTELLAHGPDRELVPKALQGVHSLPPLEYCTDAQALTAAVPPPEDPQVRARVEALQARVDRLEALDKAGKFREGAALGEPLLAEVAAVDWAPLRARTLYLMARLREGVGDYSGAVTLSRQAIPLAAKGREDTLVARAWSHQALSLGVRQGHPEQALSLRLALEAAVARASDDMASADALNSLGGALLVMGRYEEARAYYQRALTLVEKALGPQHLFAAQALGNLGTALRNLGQYEQARAHYQRALTLVEEALGPEHPLVGTLAGNLGNALGNLGQYEQAQVYYQRALAIREKALGPQHPDVASALLNLGTALKSLGQHEQARAHFERALTLYEKALGPAHPYVAEALNNLGGILWILGQYEQARACLARALVVREKALGPGHPHVARSLNSLGLVLSDMGQYGPARVHYERALAIWHKTPGTKPLDVAETYSGLGLTLVRLGELEAAGRQLEHALAIWHDAMGTKPLDLSSALLGLGELECARGRPSQALPQLERALAQAHGSERAQVQLALARALWDSGADRERAVALATEARDSYQRLKHAPGLAEASRWLARHSQP